MYMSYYNNNSGNYRSNNGYGYRSNNRYSNGGYNSGNGYNRQPMQPKKHSGARFGKDRNGQNYVSGWNYSKTRGLITVFARPYSGTKEVTSERNNVWENWFVTITNKRTMQVTKHSGLYDAQNNRVYIKELNIVMSPSKNYCGTHISKRRN